MILDGPHKTTSLAFSVFLI